jgi:putative ABC transport system permease protein
VRLASLGAEFRLASRDSRHFRWHSSLVICLVATYVAVLTATAMMTTGSDADANGLRLLETLGFVEVVLILSASFWVGFRRQARMLGLVRTVGADSGMIVRIAVLGASMLGIVGSIAGVVVGLAIGLLVLHPLASLGPVAQGMTTRTGDLLGAPALGVIATIVASLAPSRWLITATGTRPRRVRPLTRRARVLAGMAGLVAVVAGTAMVAGGVAMPGVSIALVTCGAVVIVAGVTVACATLLGLASRVSARVPVVFRVALRDLERNGREMGPGVAAIIASLAFAVALTTVLTSLGARDSRLYFPYCGPNQIVVLAPDDRTGPSGQVAAAIARSISNATAAPLVLAARPDGTRLRARSMSRALTSEPDASVAVGDAKFIADLGGRMPRLAVTSASSAARTIVYGGSQWGLGETTLDLVRGTGTVTAIPVKIVDAGLPLRQGLPSLVIAPEDARRLSLGLSAGWLVTSPTTPSARQLQIAADIAISSHTGVLATSEASPPPAFGSSQWIILSIGLLGALAMLSAVISLAAADTRAIQVTMWEIGMSPAMWRTLSAAKAFVIAALSASVALPAGLLPALAIILWRRSYPVVIPWETLVCVGIGLPALATLGAYILTRRRPSKRARREGSGALVDVAI